jgi:hypothetical protein
VTDASDLPPNLPPDFEYNPENRHLGGEVWLPELARDRDGVILEHKFVQCRILGPAVVHLADSCAFVSVNQSFNTPEQALWPTLKQSGYLVGILGLIACWFEACTFDDIAFIGNEVERKRLRDLIRFA